MKKMKKSNECLYCVGGLMEDIVGGVRVNIKCVKCRGTGQATPVCANCEGTGEVCNAVCPACHGTGEVNWVGKRKMKLKDFKNSYVRCVDIDELRDFLWDYMITVQGAEMTNMPSLCTVAYRILADGRWERKADAVTGEECERCDGSGRITTRMVDANNKYLGCEHSDCPVCKPKNKPEFDYAAERNDLLSLIDGAKICVELYADDSPAQKVWKKEWLEKACKVLGEK